MMKSAFFGVRYPTIIANFSRNSSLSAEILKSNPTEDVVPTSRDKFGKLNLHGKRAKLPERKRKEQKVMESLQPREEKMPVNQDWISVWPTARTFHPASVPLPMRQGYRQYGEPPGKFANAELMKIPNFLHLTPPAVAKHCEALKKFCTQWPEGLDSDEQCDKYFPVEVTTCDYVNSSPSIRDLRSRIVTLRVNLDSLGLNSHARDKLLRLVKDRYDPKSNVLTLVADRCPRRHQNTQYANYLLTALVYESFKEEKWEFEKQLEDFEQFVWKDSKNEADTISVVKAIKTSEKPPAYLSNSREEWHKLDLLKDLGAATEVLLNQSEDEVSINNFGSCVRKVMNLPSALRSSTN